MSPSNEYSELISFRIDWCYPLAVQGMLKSLLQHHSLIASILWCSAFFMVHLSHPYMTTRKAIALTLVKVSKVMSLLFSTLSTFPQRQRGTVVFQPLFKSVMMAEIIFDDNIIKAYKAPSF